MTRKPTATRHSPCLRPLLFPLFLALLFFPAVTFCAEWRVAPIRLDLDRINKSGSITISNDGEEKLNVQLKAYEWAQDGQGKDRYSETSDIIFLPKIATIDKKGEQVVRVGIKLPATAQEKTYRLFVEEIPQPRKDQAGTNIAIAIRFGVPIFSKPLKEEAKGEIAKLELAKGVANVTVSNAGNTHFHIATITLRGKNAAGEAVFTKELSGWYLLSGVSRLYSVQIPPDDCSRASRLEVEIKTDRMGLQGALNLDRAMCQQ